MTLSIESSLLGIGAQFDGSSVGQYETAVHHSHQGSNTNADAADLQCSKQQHKAVIAAAQPAGYGYPQNDKPMLQSWYDQTVRDESWTALAAGAKAGTTK